MILAVFAAVALASSGPAAPLQDVVSTERRNIEARAADKFAEPSQPSAAAGDPFVISIAPIDGEERIVGPGVYWTYKEGRLALRVILLEEPSPIASPDREVVIDFAGSSMAGGTYEGANAFGATRTIQSEHIIRDGLALIDAPRGDPLDYPTSRGDPLGRFGQFGYTAELGGEAARRLSHAARLRIEGHLAVLPSGRLGQCKGSHSAPTIDDPRDVSALICWAGTVVDRIAWVDGETGVELRAWSRTAP